METVWVTRLKQKDATVYLITGCVVVFLKIILLRSISVIASI